MHAEPPSCDYNIQDSNLSISIFLPSIQNHFYMPHQIFDNEHGLNAQAPHRFTLDSKQNHIVWACTRGMELLVELNRATPTTGSLLQLNALLQFCN